MQTKIGQHWIPINNDNPNAKKTFLVILGETEDKLDWIFSSEVAGHPYMDFSVGKAFWDTQIKEGNWKLIYDPDDKIEYIPRRNRLKEVD